MEPDELLTHLEETFEKVRGIYLDRGTSLFETLEGVSAGEASHEIGNGRATIAAHVEHVRFYLDVVDDVMRTQAIMKVDWREIWQSVGVVTPEEWAAQKVRLRASYQRVVSTITNDSLQGRNDTDPNLQRYGFRPNGNTSDFVSDINVAAGGPVVQNKVRFRAFTSTRPLYGHAPRVGSTFRNPELTECCSPTARGSVGTRSTSRTTGSTTSTTSSAASNRRSSQMPTCRSGRT